MRLCVVSKLRLIAAHCAVIQQQFIGIHVLFWRDVSGYIDKQFDCSVLV